ncbi:MAG: 50S ribosomal protein L30 [Deltaproteobacteria bacterium]|nr:50S ribosomal protein L30 [Candidatus Anaeroferrophillacea bacterium]
MLKITLKRSFSGRLKRHHATVQALGLRKVNQTVMREDNPAIRGMVNSVSHMLDVEQIAD